MKFKRVWFFGGDKKDDTICDGDWVHKYVGENGVEIFHMFFFGDNYRGFWEVRGKQFDHLKDAKEYAAGI